MKAIISISDLHVGSTVGLCTPGVIVVDGGKYEPNMFQKTLYNYWVHFWSEYVPAMTRGAERVVLEINGDVIDGVHHEIVSLISTSLYAQEQAACELLEGIKKLCPVKIDDIFFTVGTEVHVGKSGECEKRISKQLNAHQNEVGEHLNYQWELDVDNCVFNFAHHIGVTSSAAYESSAPMREMVAGLIESAQWGRRLPNVFVRSHRHRYIPVAIPSKDGAIQCVITPCWQLRTPNVERIDRMRKPHIGGVVFRVEDGICQTNAKLYPLPDPDPVKI